MAEVEAAAASKVRCGPDMFWPEMRSFYTNAAVARSWTRLIDPTLREFSLSDFDLAESNIFHVLDLARTPSLMAPFQVIFVKNLKNLYTRGAKRKSSRP